MTEELKQAARADITERLRKDKWHITGVDAEEAAQLIEELREQLAKAKADERHIYDAYSRCADDRSALTQRPAAQDVGVLERCAQWCDEQARSDWWGRKASDMVRSFASLPTQPAAQAAPEPVPRSVFIAGNETAMCAFASRDLADRYVSNFGGSTAGGMRVVEVPVVGATPEPEPFGQVTVRRLSRRHANHVDQYQFYPAGQLPYLDNVDECHTVYTRPAPGVPEGWREVIEKMVKGIDHLAELARQWEPDYSSGADRKGWVLAKNARDEAVDMLAAAQAKGGE